MDDTLVSFSTSTHHSPPLRRSNTSPHLVSNTASSSEDVSPTRQQRMLRQRNARFLAKKLSISGLSSKLTHLTDSCEFVDTLPSVRSHENKAAKSKSICTSLGSKTSARPSSILDDLSNSAQIRHQRQRGQIPIFNDNLEEVLLDLYPKTSSSFYSRTDGGLASSQIADDSHGGITGTHLREIDLNHPHPSHGLSPTMADTRAKVKSHSIASFDHDQYIEHLEMELQDAKNEACSPLTRRPLKEKLRVATKENENLQRELNLLKERFETEVKRTVEHKTAVEVALRRKVRELESVLEDKENLVRQLQNAYEDRRLDFNTVEVLRTTIDRLEVDKQNLEEINLSMSKRNEVLTQLLAMSPTRMQQDTQIRSPIRDKRHARPMSLILPRLPCSPKQSFSATSASSSTSPRAQVDGDISPLKLSPIVTADDLTSTCSEDRGNMLSGGIDPSTSSENGPHIRSETFPSNTQHLTGVGDGRIVPKRKPRRFIAGSTQLKPLLLPALTGESAQSATESGPPSPYLPSSRRFSLASTSSMLDPSLADHEDSFPIDRVAVRPQNVRPLWQYTPQINSRRSSEEFRLEPSSITQTPADLSPLILDQQKVQTAHIRVACLHEQLAIHAAEVSALFERTTSSNPSPSYGNNTDYDADVNIPMPLFSPEPSAVLSGTGGQVACISLPSSPLAMITSKKRRRNVRSMPASSLAQNKSLDSTPIFHPTADTVSPPAYSRSPINKTNNFVGLITPLRKDARTLTAIGIGTVYRIITNCAKEYHKFRQDPFALARRVIANAWRINWRVFGKLSWWVLGLFIHPCTTQRARAPIDWDQYDGESIADRYCRTPNEQSFDKSDCQSSHDAPGSGCEPSRNLRPINWAKSLVMWGKFSFAVMLAVGGAVVKGPNEMMKDVKSNGPPSETSIGDAEHENGSPCESSPDTKLRASGHGQGTSNSSTNLQSRTPLQQLNASELYEKSMSLYESPKQTHVRAPDENYSRLESDEDATLRPLKRPRTHIEDFFQAPSDVQNQPGDASYQSRAFNADHRNQPLSLDDGILGWPCTDLALDSTLSFKRLTSEDP